MSEGSGRERDEKGEKGKLEDEHERNLILPPQIYPSHSIEKKVSSKIKELKSIYPSLSISHLNDKKMVSKSKGERKLSKREVGGERDRNGEKMN